MSLKIARKIAGLTQQALAKRAGVDHSLISRFESRERDLHTTDYRNVVRIAVALNLEPEELIAIVEQARPRRRRGPASAPAASSAR